MEKRHLEKEAEDVLWSVRTCRGGNKPGKDSLFLVLNKWYVRELVQNQSIS